VLDGLFVDRGGANDPVRPGLHGALSLLGEGGHVALVVASFDGVARRPQDWYELQAKAAVGGWALVVPA
jgi:hypothetical protein